MRRADSSRSGGILFEALGAVTLLLILLPGLARLWDMGMDEVQKRSVATHLQGVSRAAGEYVREHRDTLQASATASRAARVTMAQLSPHLPHGFLPRNAWGQTYGVFVLQPAPGRLVPVVLTYGGSRAGRRFSNVVVPSTAALAGGQGGYVPSGDLPGQSTAELRGSFGAWSVPLSGTSIPNPGPGHLGAVASMDGQDLDQDFLYRVAVPGKPELNEMSTELDMTDHAIRGVSELQFEPHDLMEMGGAGFCADPSREGRVFLDRNHGLYVCRDGKPRVVADTGNSALLSGSTIAVDGELVPKPTCPPGTDAEPRIFVAPSIVAQGADASSLVAVQAWATDEGDDWRVHLRVLTTDKNAGWIHPGPDFGRVMVFATCN